MSITCFEKYYTYPATQGQFIVILLSPDAAWQIPKDETVSINKTDKPVSQQRREKTPGCQAILSLCLISSLQQIEYIILGASV